MHPDILLLLDKPHPAASSSFLRNSGPGPQHVALGDLTRGVQGRAKGCMQPWGGVTVRNQPSPCASMFEPQGKTYQEPLTSLSVSLPLSVSVSPLLQHPGSFLSLSAHTCVHMHTHTHTHPQPSLLALWHLCSPLPLRVPPPKAWRPRADNPCFSSPPRVPLKPAGPGWALHPNMPVLSLPVQDPNQTGKV